MSKGLAVPLVAVVLGQVAYHLMIRTTPKNYSAVFMILVAYVAGACLLSIVFLLERRLPGAQSGIVSWDLLVRAAGVGASICLIEVGYVYAYRRGLPLSFGALVVFATTTAVLVPLSIFAFHQALSIRAFIGVSVIVVGLMILSL